jgi:hypothetical protein
MNALHQQRQSKMTGFVRWLPDNLTEKAIPVLLFQKSKGRYFDRRKDSGREGRRHPARLKGSAKL